VVKLPHTEEHSLLKIEEMIFNLSEKYLDDKLVIEDLTEISFTITDLSGEGVSFFTPLINKYNSAILGLSSTDNKTKYATLSLSFDHRVTEGKLASSFLAELKERVESYAVGDDNTDRMMLSCYRCFKTQNEDLSGLGMIPCITPEGNKAYLCTTCLTGH
jgi:pyruvate/2-oxoglutarate dehydrogenase complex dihydrolipoamide acyltransferase (E2) component